MPASRVDEHVSACAHCSEWWQRALSQAEALRLAPLPLAPVFRVELPKRQLWRTRLATWLGRPGSVELRLPEGASPGRKTNHLRIVEEPPA